MNARPAAVADVREAAPPEPEFAPSPRPEPTRRMGPKLVLAALFVASAAYHALQSRFHLTPAIFTDELLHSKLAQSFAAGDGFSLRGEPFFFPSALPALFQAPAWLADSMPGGYALAKMANALVMSAAVFPAYWVARALVRPSYALLTAAAAVAAPAMLYHSYLVSEALAYPVFFFTLGVMVRALGRPSPRLGLAVLGVSALAVGTRTQFVALPLAYAISVFVAGRGELRRHALTLGGLAAFGVIGLALGGAALGPYADAAALEYPPMEVVRWSALTAVLLPFAAGVFVVPGALFGLAFAIARPRVRAEAPFAVLLVGIAAVFLVQIGLVAAGDSQRPLERYAIYLAPLLFLAFFLYVERGAPRHRAYAAVALALGSLAWLVPFPSLADFRFSFDSPVLAAYGQIAVWIGHANAATVFAAVPLLAAAALALRPLRRRAVHLFAGATIALLFASGLAAYAGDHAMTRRTLDTWSAERPDWLDRLGVGRADYLALPGGSPHYAWVFEAWNRDFGRPIRLEVERPRFELPGAARADVRGDGVLLVDGRPADPGLLVVNDYASQIELDGEVVAAPSESLTLYRVPAFARVRSLATGVFFDRWAGQLMRFRVWPGRRVTGFYRIELELPTGMRAREIRVAVDGGATKTARVEPGGSATVELRAAGGDHGPLPSLRLMASTGDLVEAGTPNPRVVSVRVRRLEFVSLTPAPKLSL
jgi:hypothetical protein